MKRTKKTTYIVAIFIFFSAILYFNIADQALKSSDKIQSLTTAQGVNFWLLEDHYLPIVSVKISFPHSGSAYDPNNKTGLANLVALLLNEGAGDYDEFTFHSELEAIATDIDFWVDEDYFYVSLKTLSEHITQAIKLMEVALTQPHFSPESIERVKEQLKVAITKQQQKPSYLALEKLRNKFYGNHPYARAREGTIESLDLIERKDLLHFVTEHFTKENINVSVVGDVEVEKISVLLDSSFSSLAQISNREVVAVDSPVPSSEGGVFYVSVNVPQTFIAFASAAPLRGSDDFYPMYILNYILGGGGFESRLMQKVREEEGLVYSVSSSYDTNEKSGLIIGTAATEKKKAHKTIEAIKDEYKKIYSKGITEKELADAKSYLINSFPLKMTKNTYLASFLDAMQQQELGINFLDERNKMVESVTLAQINDVAKRWLSADNVTIISAGSVTRKE